MARDYQAVTTLADLDSLIKELGQDPSRMVAFDVETGYSTPKPVEKRALDMYHPDFFVVGCSLTNHHSWARYIPLRHDSEQFFEPREVWEKMRPVLEKQPILAHHKKFEDKILRGLPAQGDADAPILTQVGHDSMIAAYVSGQYKETGLKYLSHEILGEDQAAFSSLFASADGTPAKPAVVKKARFNHLSPTSAQVVSYACDDAALCLALFDLISQSLTDDQKRVYGLEMAISALMVEAEEFGVGVAWADMKEAKRRGEQFRPLFDNAVRERLASMTHDPRIREKVRTVNYASAPQMRSLLYTDLGLSTTRTTPKGELSTDAQALEGLSRHHAGVRGLLDYRETTNLSKRLSKWLDEYSGARDGRVHASFAQTKVVTGRFSANDPAIQQLGKDWLWSVKVDDAFKPVVEDGDINGKDHWMGNFREFIVAGENHYLLGYDYSQIELRVLAGVTQEPTLLQAFSNGIDPHVATAAMMLGMPIDQVGSKERSQGKTLNFALLYGMGPKSMAERLAISLEEAKALEAQYKAQFKNISSWDSFQRTAGVRNKFVTTWLGRTVPLWAAWSDKPGLVAQAERLAVNAPIQGGAADYVKLAMVRSKALLQQAGLWGPGKVMLTMNQHDALCFEVHESIDPTYLREILTGAVIFDAQSMFPGMQVPKFPAFEVDWEIGLTWGGSRSWKADETVSWREDESQWAFDGQDPFRRADASVLSLEEPEQIALTLDALDEPDPLPEPEAEAQPEAQPEEEFLRLKVGYELEDKHVSGLVELFTKFPGERAVTLTTPGLADELVLSARTSLTVDDCAIIRVVLPDAVVS